jgi:hypothetical protein
MVRCVVFALLTICAAQDDDYISAAETRNMQLADEVAVSLLQRQASMLHTGDDVVSADVDTDEVSDGDLDALSMEELDSDALDFVDSQDPEETCDAFDEANPTLVKVDFALAENSISNLGGVGPQTGAAEQLYYKHAATANANGDYYDLKVTVRGDSYHAKTPHTNGENGHYGVINVACGTSVDLEFQFVNPTTGEPASLEHLIFSWFDLDKGRFGGGDEQIVLWPGHSNTIVSSFTEIEQDEVDCPAGADAQKCKSFLSSTWGVGKDNPTNPMTLTKQQAARTFSVEYKHVSSFSVTLSAAAGFGSRNFLFTGMSQVAYSSVEECCPEHVCGCQSSCSESDATWENKCTLAKCSACDECVETTTTTTAGPVTKEETCNDGLTFELTSDNLVENTLGVYKKGRMLFKKVLEYEGRFVDLSVTDAAKKPEYSNAGRRKYKVDSRGYTGEYKGAGRVAFDTPGLYMLRFQILDSETGEETKLSLFPFTFYDVDGQGEAVSACNVAGLTHDDTALTERDDTHHGCVHFVSTKKEANIPTDFESLTLNQKKVAVTFMYRNTGSWDVGVALSPYERDRYILFKSSKVLACDYEDFTRDEPWKNKGKTGDA